MALPTNVFSAGQQALASQFNQNGSDFAAAISQLRTGNLASDAGITSRQLAQRFAFWNWEVNVLPISANSTPAIPPTGGNLYTIPAAMSRFWAGVLRLMGGQECYLSEVEVYVANATVGGAANYPQLQILKNGVLVGGAARTLNLGVDAFYRLRKADPVAQPLIGCQDGDVLEIQMAKSDGGACIAGVNVRFRFKNELVS